MLLLVVVKCALCVCLTLKYVCFMCYLYYVCYLCGLCEVSVLSNRIFVCFICVLCLSYVCYLCFICDLYLCYRGTVVSGTAISEDYPGHSPMSRCVLGTSIDLPTSMMSSSLPQYPLKYYLHDNNNTGKPLRIHVKMS